MKKFILILALAALTLPLFSQEEQPKNISALVSGSFGFYPTFKFGSATPDENLTDPKVTRNVMWSLQAGVNLWKDFNFMLDFFMDTDELKDNPVGILTKLSGQLGYKGALVSLKRHNTKGNYLWVDGEGEEAASRTDFALTTTILNLQYDISSFFQDTLGGWYVGLSYLTHSGVSTITEKKVKYPIDIYYRGFGICVGIDTLTGYLLNSFNPFLFWDFEVENKERFFMPWVKLGWEITLGQTSYTMPLGEDVSTFGTISTIDLVLGAAYIYKTSVVDITFSAGYNPTFYMAGGLLHNEGLIIRASFRF